MRQKRHPKSVARALLAERRIWKITEADAQALTARAAANVQVEGRLKVELPRIGHQQLMHHHGTHLHRLVHSQRQLAIDHHGLSRARRVHERELRQLLGILKVEPHQSRRTCVPCRRGGAPDLLAAHVRRMHRRVGVAKAAQCLAERLEAHPKHSHLRGPGHQAAAWAQAKHFLRVVVRKLHGAAAVLLPIHRDLDAHVRSSGLLRRGARQIGVAHEHRAHHHLPELATVVRARGELRTMHGHKCASSSRSA